MFFLASRIEGACSLKDLRNFLNRSTEIAFYFCHVTFWWVSLIFSCGEKSQSLTNLCRKFCFWQKIEEIRTVLLHFSAGNTNGSIRYRLFPKFSHSRLIALTYLAQNMFKVEPTLKFSEFVPLPMLKKTTQRLNVTFLQPIQFLKPPVTASLMLGLRLWSRFWPPRCSWARVEFTRPRIG